MKIAILSPSLQNASSHDSDSWYSIHLLVGWRPGAPRHRGRHFLCHRKDPSKRMANIHKKRLSLPQESKRSFTISEVFEQANEFDVIHNHLGLLPLTYTTMTSTPHGDHDQQNFVLSDPRRLSKVQRENIFTWPRKEQKRTLN